MEGEREKERMQGDIKKGSCGEREKAGEKQAKLKGVRHKPQEICAERSGRGVEGRKTNTCQTAKAESGSILSDKLGEMFTLHIHYANGCLFSCVTFQKPPGCQRQPRR